MRALQDIFTASAARRPDAAAVIASSGTFSYSEIDRMANRVGRRLLAVGVSRGDRVGLWLDKSGETVAAMQACLRIGAIYVPIDPLSPIERARKIMSDCDMRALVTTSARGETLPRPAPTFVHADEAFAELAAESDDPLPPCGTGDQDIAYILYTSGSTGTPKGVCLTHENALAFIAWSVETTGASENDRFSNHAPFHFDLSVFDLYVAFSVGASVAIVPEGIAYIPRKLVRFMEQQRITVWYSVPSALIMMMDHGGLLESATLELSTIVFAGEPFPIAPLRRLRAHFAEARLYNFYGPTETNVCTAYEVHSIADVARSIPIGAAASYDRVWVETADGALAGPGEEGELIVDGPTVMHGYWGKDPVVGPYRTGDLVRLRADGDFDYVGRRDQMVKVRGHRIELGEIESALETHPDILHAAAYVRGLGVDARLVACIVPKNGTVPSLIDVKRFSAAHLPRYMIVDHIVPLEDLPRTRNGKLDRNALHGTPVGTERT